MARQFDRRSERRIKNAVKKAERTLSRGYGNAQPAFFQIVEGLLKDDLDEPEELGELEEQDVQIWVRNVEEDKLEKALKDGEEITIKVANRFPGESYEKGCFVTCMMIGGEWRIVGASCDTFEDELED